jgi:hypothetical protein
MLTTLSISLYQKGLPPSAFFSYQFVTAVLPNFVYWNIINIGQGHTVSNRNMPIWVLFYKWVLYNALILAINVLKQMHIVYIYLLTQPDNLCEGKQVGSPVWRPQTLLDSSEAKFLVLDMRIKSTLAWGFRTGPPAYVAWRDGIYDNPMPESTTVYHPSQELRIRLQAS